MKKDLNILTRENYSEKEEYFLNGTNNCEICFLLTDELAKTNEFERFFQNFSEKMLMSRKLIDLNVSAVLFGKNEEGSFLIDFKKLEKFSFIKSQKKKIIDLYSLEEISWTRQSKKLLVAFISKETEIERFLMINKHFIHKTNTKCILISPSSNLLQKLDVEALESTWEEIEDLPNIISNILF